jgi:hypothetical protein
MAGPGHRYRVCFAGLFAWILLVSTVDPVFSQTSNFLADERSEECFKILGINTLALVTANPADTAKAIAEAAGVRAQEIQTVITNIKGDYFLAQEFGDLNTYEGSYLLAAGNRFLELTSRLEEIKKEIECWKHFERMFRLAEQGRPPAPPASSEPDKISEPPVDPDPIGTGAVFELAKEYFDRRARDIAELEERIGRNRTDIDLEIEIRRAEEVIASQIDAAHGHPAINTRSAQTTNGAQEESTLVLGGIRFFAGGSLGPSGNGDFSSNPGNQVIDFDGNGGWRLRGGAVLPLGRNFGIGAGIIYDHSSNDVTRLTNPNGTFVNLSGNANVHSVAAELMLLARLQNGITGRISGYAGKAWRDADLRIGGVRALNFSDTVGVTGIGFGVGVPAANLGLNLPRVCFDAGVDFLRFGGANGVTPTGVPIQLGSMDQVSLRFGVTVDFPYYISETTGDPVWLAGFCP